MVKSFFSILVAQLLVYVSAYAQHRVIDATDSIPVSAASIFDFDGNLYGKLVEISFLYFIREERKFEGLAELEAQIRCDIERAKNYF